MRWWRRIGSESWVLSLENWKAAASSDAAVLIGGVFALTSGQFPFGLLKAGKGEPGFRG